MLLLKRVSLRIRKGSFWAEKISGENKIKCTCLGTHRRIVAKLR